MRTKTVPQNLFQPHFGPFCSRLAIFGMQGAVKNQTLGIKVVKDV